MGVNRPGRGVDHPPLFSAKVKERVELYLCLMSGPLWSVVGWTLPLAFTCYILAYENLPSVLRQVLFFQVIEASIHVPASLFYQLEMQGYPVKSGQQLLVSMYENNRLFPRILADSSLQDGRDITSCVIGTKLGENYSAFCVGIYVCVEFTVL